MTTYGALCVASLLLVLCSRHAVVNSTLDEQKSAAAGDAETAAAAAAAAVMPNDVDRPATRYNRSAGSLLCDGKRCQGKLGSSHHAVMQKSANFISDNCRAYRIR